MELTSRLSLGCRLHLVIDLYHDYHNFSDPSSDSDLQVSGTGIWETHLAPPITIRPVQKLQQVQVPRQRPRLKVRMVEGRLFSADGPLMLFSHSLPMRLMGVTSMLRSIPNQHCRTQSRFMDTRCIAGRNQLKSDNAAIQSVHLSSYCKAVSNGELVPQKPLPLHI